MNAPTPKEISEMERLRKIMEGERPINQKPIEVQQREASGEIILSKGPTSKDVDVMANIMKNFSDVTGVKSFKSAYDVGGNFDRVINEVANKADSNQELHEALMTEKTNDGVKIGIWEIRKVLRESQTGKKEVLYKVYNTNTDQSIKASFIVLEGAKAVVKLLNNGSSLKSKKIQEIAELEIEYRRQRQRALEEKVHWQRAVKAKNEMKQHLYEAKFDAAKTHALYTKERIINTYHQISKSL